MQKTEHYGLNLWGLSDRILMDDFNADNAKLDAALAGLAKGADILKDTFSEPDPVYFIGRTFWDALAPTQWEDYSIVLVMGSVTKADDNAIPYASLVYLGAENYMEDENASFTFAPGGFLYILTPMKSPDRLVEGFFISSGMATSFQGTRPFSEIDQFRVGGKTPGGTGANVTVQNVRAIGIR